jgi:hypothetical protein
MNIRKIAKLKHLVFRVVPETFIIIDVTSVLVD